MTTTHAGAYVLAVVNTDVHPATLQHEEIADTYAAAVARLTEWAKDHRFDAKAMQESNDMLHWLERSGGWRGEPQRWTSHIESIEVYPAADRAEAERLGWAGLSARHDDQLARDEALAILDHLGLGQQHDVIEFVAGFEPARMPAAARAVDTATEIRARHAARLDVALADLGYAPAQWETATAGEIMRGVLPAQIEAELTGELAGQ